MASITEPKVDARYVFCVAGNICPREARCLDNNYQFIDCPPLMRQWTQTCPDGSNKHWVTAYVLDTMVCPRTDIVEENNCGASKVGDPFDTLTGVQTETFVDLDLGGVGLRLARTFQTMTSQKDILSREVLPEVAPWTGAFGISWHWEYGAVAFMRGSPLSARLEVLEKDGLIRHFTQIENGRWMNDRGEGEVRRVRGAKFPAVCMSKACLEWYKASGERNLFVYVDKREGIHLWRLERIVKPDEALEVTVEYLQNSVVFFNTPSVVRTNKGGELRFTWRAGEPWLYWPTLSPRFPDSAYFANKAMTDVDVYVNGQSANIRVTYGYSSFQHPNYDKNLHPGMPNLLTSVSVNGQLRWAYGYDASGNGVNWRIKTAANGRGDVTTLSWGDATYDRRSYVTDSRGKVFEDVGVVWSGNDTTLKTTISARVNSVGARKSTTQTFSVLPFKELSARIRKLAGVAGPGCASCGAPGPERYRYSEETGLMEAKCDADGVVTTYSNDVYGTVTSTKTGLDASMCAAPSYIVDTGDRQAVTNLKTSPQRPGGDAGSARDSVMQVGAQAWSARDFDDPARDESPDMPNSSAYSADRVVADVSFGYTRLIGGAIVPQAQRTQYTYLPDIDEVSGPRPESLTRRVYYPNSKRLYYVERRAGNGITLRTTYENYDSFGNPTRVIDANGLVTEYEYNTWNKVSVERQYLNGMAAPPVLTRFFFDGAGDLDYVILPAGNAVDYDYVARGYLVSVRRLEWADTQGNKGPVIDEVRYEFDPEGHRTRETYLAYKTANPTITYDLRTTFDVYGRVASIVNAKGETEQRWFSPTGLLLAVTDATAKTTGYLYDSLRRLYEVHSPDGGLTRYGYNTNNDIIAVGTCQVPGCDMAPGSVDPNFSFGLFQYDDFGRLVWSQSSDGGINEFEYNEAGDLVKKLDARGFLAFYSYDAANRLTDVQYLGTSLFNTFYYDSYAGSENTMGRLAAAKDDEGLTILSYDLAGRVVKEVRQSGYAEGSAQVVTRRTFDDNGNLRSLTYPSGVTVFYDPSVRDVDRVGTVRLVTPQGEQVLAANVAFDPGNLLKALDLGNGLTTTVVRDTALRVTNLKSGAGGTKVVDRSYTYFPNGNVSAIADNTRVTPDQAFTYDPANRLLTAAGAYGNLAWTYDSSGNRRSETDGNKLDNYSYGTHSNRLLTVIDPPLGTARATASATPGAKQAALVQIDNQLLDLFFSGERFLNQSLGLGSFSSGKSVDNRTDNPNASSAYALFVRKATDTTELLKTALTDGRVTLAEVKASALADVRLQDAMNQFFADLRAIPTDQATPFVRQFFGLFSLTDLLLLNQVLDLASRLGLPQGAGGAPDDPIIMLTNRTDSPEADAEWRGIVDDVRHVAKLGKHPTLAKLFAAPEPDAGDGEVARHIDDMKARVVRLSAQGLTAVSVAQAAAADTEIERALLALGVAAAPQLGAADASSGGLFATLALGTPNAYLVYAFDYDRAGNATSINRFNQTTNYQYGADNRLRQVGDAVFSYDYLGRRIAATYSDVLTTLSGLPPSPATVFESWTYDTNGDMLRWGRRESVGDTASRTVEENYVYAAGTRLAKLVITTTTSSSGAGGGGGGSGGGGCCCAATAIAGGYPEDGGHGDAQCDFASQHALQVLRGFRTQVLSGKDWGERVIRFYYHDLSRAVVPVLREYPELRHALSYGLRAVAWVLAFWVTPAYADVLSDTTYQLYYYHNGLLGEPIALTDSGGRIVRHVEHDPFGARERAYVSAVDDRMLFPGQFMDSTSGLVYNWNRWYSPEIGRYVEPEPQGATSYVYGYADQNPLIKIDPPGLLSPAAAYYHYLFGNGEALNVSINEVGTENVKASSFPQIRAAIADRTPREVPISDTRYLQASGMSQEVFGGLYFNLIGTIKITNCGWCVSGTLGVTGGSLYDFNKGNRSFFAETSTTIGRWGGKPFGAKDYQINILGRKAFSECGDFGACP
jgi:RHS repeat-associated protein